MKLMIHETFILTVKNIVCFLFRFYSSVVLLHCCCGWMLLHGYWQYLVVC